MSSRNKDYCPRLCTETETTPFSSAEEAWFWFIQAQASKCEGARIKAGAGLVSRPCEPLDILQSLDRLYRTRRVLMDHLLVLRHYGRRMMAPDARRTREARAHTLWTEAMARLEAVLVNKKIVVKPFLPNPAAGPFWYQSATVYQGAER